MSEILGAVVAQALATAHNYYQTGRPDKAVEMLVQVRKLSPDGGTNVNLLIEAIWCRQQHLRPPIEALADRYGVWWGGEDLTGKSLEVFCDQGMGDVLNLYRYLAVLKGRWPDCRILLNCYAHFEKMATLLAHFGVVEVRRFHERCDYSANIMCVPAIMAELPLPHYPARFVEFLKVEVPHQQPIEPFEPMELHGDGPAVGLVWESEPANIHLHQVKSVPITALCHLEDGRRRLYALAPNDKTYNFVTQLPILDLFDAARAIEAMDVVVSCDTVALHLAGLMGKTAFGLLAFDHDPRWGEEETCVWYPTVRLFRCPEPGEWAAAVSAVRLAMTDLGV